MPQSLVSQASLVVMDWTVVMESLAHLVHQALLAVLFWWDPVALVTTSRLLGRKETRVCLDHKGCLVPLAFLAHLVSLVMWVAPELLVFLGLLEKWDL